MSQELQFQQYFSAKSTLNMITPGGDRIRFVNHSFITSSDSCKRYLNNAMQNPVLGITKGDVVDKEAADPLAHLKKQIISEYLAKRNVPEKVEVEEVVEQPKVAPSSISPMSSAILSKLAKESNTK